MGYKLAGYEVVGGVEIDSRMMDLYRANHAPRHSYLMGIETFNGLDTSILPSELLDLDILDGSPPCSSFSMAGARERHWGTLKMFREGQQVQVLDDLFGHFLVTVNKLRPKVVVAENVKGMLTGHARGYVAEVLRGFREIGYQCQIFLLNAAKMGVPQARERVFFVANRIDKTLSLSFAEAPISLHEAIHDVRPVSPRLMTRRRAYNWHQTSIGDRFGGMVPQTMTPLIRCDPTKPVPTLTANNCCVLYHWSECRELQQRELNRIQTFPDDFDFGRERISYVCGMSVPPYMMQRLSRQIAHQFFDRSL